MAHKKEITAVRTNHQLTKYIWIRLETNSSSARHVMGACLKTWIDPRPGRAPQEKESAQEKQTSARDWPQLLLEAIVRIAGRHCQMSYNWTSLGTNRVNLHIISSQTSRAPSTVPRLLRSPRKLRKFRCLNPSLDRAIITLVRAKFIKQRETRNITVIINSKRDELLYSKSALAKVRPIREP